MSNLVPNAYLGCAEPSWAASMSEWQLNGIINLAALLAPRLLISDVHFGDNFHFFRSYISQQPNGLYNRVRRLSSAGVITFLLRDQAIRIDHASGSQQSREIESFYDVFRAWKEFDPPDAWIFKEFTEERRQFFREVDTWLKKCPVQRYNYVDLKHEFMQLTRKALSFNKAPWAPSVLSGLNTKILEQHRNIIDREWFTLSDFYDFFQRCYPNTGRIPLLYHGLLNEIAYSHYTSSNIVGFDQYEIPIQSSIWGAIDETNSTEKFTSQEHAITKFLEYAVSVIDTPSLSLLALLKPEEILELREYGRGYFEFMEHQQRTKFSPLSNLETINSLSYTAIWYWEKICDYLALRHPSPAKKPSKLALFFNRLPTPISKILPNAFHFAVNLGREATFDRVPTAQKLVGRLIHFVFFTDREEFVKLKQVIPNNSWSRGRVPYLQ